MRVFRKRPSSGKRIAALAVALAVTAVAMPRPVRAEPDAVSLAQLDTVYVADPAAPWFEKWTEAHLRPRDWLYRPDIRIKAGGDLVAAVAETPSAIGLMTRGELARLQAAGAPAVASVPTGLSICASLVVNGARVEENFGDFALSGGTIEVLASTDTLAIAQALIEAHHFADKMTVKEVKPASAIAELASGKAAIAMLPVLPDARLHLPENVRDIRPIALTAAESESLRLRGLHSQVYRTSFVQKIPFMGGVRTACDEIVLIRATGAAVASEAFHTPSAPSWTNPFNGSDLEKRVWQALGALKSLWNGSAETKG
jgi:hypothetical protein